MYYANAVIWLATLLAIYSSLNSEELRHHLIIQADVMPTRVKVRSITKKYRFSVSRVCSKVEMGFEFSLWKEEKQEIIVILVSFNLIKHSISF